jgi:hypothetical protein
MANNMDSRFRDQVSRQEYEARNFWANYNPQTEQEKAVERRIAIAGKKQAILHDALKKKEEEAERIAENMRRDEDAYQIHMLAERGVVIRNHNNNMDISGIHTYTSTGKSPSVKKKYVRPTLWDYTWSNKWNEKYTMLWL